MQAAKLRNLDRRRFLRGAILCLSGSVLPEALASSVMAAGAAAPWQALFPDPKAAAAVGRRYLREHPQEASAGWLARSLFGSKAPWGAGDDFADQVIEKIRLGRQRDFHDGGVVVIDGWFFARTEARLLALVSLYPA